MRSKTAEFERMLDKPISKSQSSQFHSQSASGARSNDSKPSMTKTIKISKCHQINEYNILNLLAEIINDLIFLSAEPDSTAARNGPIYKRRDVISSASNAKK